MLVLAIIATVVEVLSLLKPVSDIFTDTQKSDMPFATFTGGILALAIRSIVIVTIWVFYSNIG